jgi:glycosyltransferase involved in cell wall biosynthesis
LGLRDKLTVGAIRVSKENRNYSATRGAETREVLSRANASLKLLENGTDGTESYGYIEHWQEASSTAYQLVADLGTTSDDLLIVSFDTPFLFLGELLQGLHNAHYVHIPRSTGLLHDPAYQQRISAEKHAYSLPSYKGQNILGAISPYMKRHLMDDYGVRGGKMKPIYNGVLMNDHEKYTTSEVNKAVTDVGLTPDDKFILAYGRAHEYKGFHTMLKALALMDNPPAFVLIAASNQKSNSYVDSLKKLIKENSLTGKLITHFDQSLPLLLQQAPSLQAVVVPSLKEPFGLIPVENFANPYSVAPVIAAESGGLTMQVLNGVTGLTYKPGSAPQLADCIAYACKMDSEERDRLKIKAMGHVRENFDYSHNIEFFMSDLVNIGNL